MFRNFISKITTYFAIGIGLLCVVLLYLMNNQFTKALEFNDLNNISQLKSHISEPIVSPLYNLLIFCVILVGAVLVASIGFTIYNNPKEFLRILAGLSVFFVLFIICYVLASQSIPVDDGTTLITTGLYMLYGLLGLAVVGIVGTEIRNSVVQ